MASWPLTVVAGLAIGLLMALFGVGGSCVATPVLSLLGVPGLAAVASPLSATIPAAILAGTPRQILFRRLDCGSETEGPAPQSRTSPYPAPV